MLLMYNWLKRRKQWHRTPVLLPGKSHGRRSLVGCSPWGRWELDTAERLHFHFSLSCTGEGNGNPLQCSCLENPRDCGAWCAVIYGVAQSRTRFSMGGARDRFGIQCSLWVYQHPWLQVLLSWSPAPGTWESLSLIHVPQVGWLRNKLDFPWIMAFKFI